MQPYFLPYIGYFQLMNAVDEFIVYDNIEFTKKGWISRNRILVNGCDAFISLPLKKDSDFLDIKERFLADTWESEKAKLLNKITESYRKAPFFKIAFDVISQCIKFEERNLFNFIFNSLYLLNLYLEINTTLVISSSVSIDHSLKATKKVIALCKAKNADYYINPIGGVELYNREEFKTENIDLNFLKSDNIIYPQFNNDFIPGLSIVDVMMFNPKEKIKEYLNSYSLI